MAKAPSATIRKRRPAAKAEALADEPLTFDDEGIKRVADIIRNARATWFALLGALVFASVTLAGVKDISFFVNTVETKLPIVGISVPVVSFFWAGSLLTAALYAYFHLYLELLWQALGDAPARINGKPMADRIEPWIVADAALRFRDRLRGAHGEERASRQRAMQFVSDVVSVGLVWVFGLLVIFWFWWRSMPAHNVLLTAFLGIILLFSIFIGVQSALAFYNNFSYKIFSLRNYIYFIAFLAILSLSLIKTEYDLFFDVNRSFVSNICIKQSDKYNFARCLGKRIIDFFRPTSANLERSRFNNKTEKWRSEDVLREEFFEKWCVKKNPILCRNFDKSIYYDMSTIELSEFYKDWKLQWRKYTELFQIATIRDTDFSGANLPESDFEYTNVTNSSFRGAFLMNSNFTSSILYSSNFSRSMISYSIFKYSNMENCSIENSEFISVNFSDTEMMGCNFENTNSHSSDYSGANLENSVLDNFSSSANVFRNSNLERVSSLNAVFQNANFTNTNLSGGDFTNSSFIFSDFENVKIRGANFHNAKFGFGRFFGKRDSHVVFWDENLVGSEWLMIGLRFVDFEGANLDKVKYFDKAFGDGTVSLPIGYATPSHWCPGQLTDEQYFGRWRGWVESQTDQEFGDELFSGFSAIPPSEPCPKEGQ